MSGSSRVIFSVYKEVNDNSVTDYKKEQLKLYKDKLIKRQHDYAKFCGADYFVYENNNQITDEYNSIQFFKIEQLEILSKKYNEVLYLDLDIIPFKFVNFFEQHDLSKICCYRQDGEEWGLRRYFSITFKEWNMYENLDSLDSQNWWVKSCSKNAMLLLDNHKEFNNMLVNTAVIGGNRESISKLKFKENLNYMLDLIEQSKHDNIYPKQMHQFFIPNNEVFFSYLIEKNNVPILELNKEWNFIIDNFDPDWENIIFLHLINKHFEKYNKKFNIF